MFLDREQAGVLLAERLKGRELHDPLVLAIPRGGIVIGAALAQALGAELDVVLSRKLGFPGQPEAAIGAIAETGAIYLNPEEEDVLVSHENYLSEERNRQLAEIERRKKLVREIRPPAPIAGRSVIVTDDGIATGSTMLAALQVLRSQHPRELIVAVPVVAPDMFREIRLHCDEVVALLVPRWLGSVGQFYEDFSPVEEERVLHLLRESQRAGEESEEQHTLKLS
jgi:predicted phosphoribosyltransferase